MENLIEYVNDKIKDWTNEYTLTYKQVEQLIAEKLERARVHLEAAKKVYQD